MKNKISEILALVLKVNTETEHTAAMDFSGHVNLVSVRVYLGEWKPNAISDIWMDSYFGENECLNKHGGYTADEIINRLNSILEKELAHA